MKAFPLDHHSHTGDHTQWGIILTLGNLFQECNLKEVKAHMHRYFAALFILETIQMSNNRRNNFANLGTST